jgi:hypothetical protein
LGWYEVTQHTDAPPVTPSAAASNRSSAAAAPPVPPDPYAVNPVQVPFSANTSSLPASAMPASPQPLNSSSHSNATALGPPNQIPPTPPDPSPNLLATHAPPPTAAFAVPLSAVGAILLLAGWLGLRNNKRLAEERAQEAIRRAMPIPGTPSQASNTTKDDVEIALEALQRSPRCSEIPPPTFLSVFAPVEQRCLKQTRQPYVVNPDPYMTPPSMEKMRTRGSSNSRYCRNLTRNHSVASNYSTEGSATDSVIDDYFNSSGMRTPQVPSSLIAAPQRLHLRQDADHERQEYTEMSHVDLYDSIARNLLSYRREY